MPGLQEAQKVRQPPEIPSALRSARPGDRPTSYLLRMTNLAERGMMPGVQTATPRGFPRWWTITGYVLLAAAALFAGRIIYEETILTWNNGPQMVGFALAHGAAPVFLIAGLIALPGGSVWVIGSLILLLRRRFRIKLIDWAPVIFLPVLAALLCIPYAVWEEFTVAAAGPGTYGKEFMVEAAAQGRQGFVRYLLAKGYDINYEDSGGTTALSGAAVEGRVAMVKFLVAKGADVNRKDHVVGETALIGAAETGQLKLRKHCSKVAPILAQRTTTGTTLPGAPKNTGIPRSRNI